MSYLLRSPLRNGPRMHPGFVSGVPYWATNVVTATSTAVPAVDVLYGYAFRVGAAVSITALQTRCATGGATSANKVGVWRMTGGRPFGLPIAADNTGLATTANNTTQDHTAADAALPDDFLFWASVYTGTLPVMVHANATSLDAARLTGAASLTTTGHTAGLSTPFAYSGDIRNLNLTGATWSYAPTGVPLLAFVPA
jgi:hypothetical protein